MTSNTPSSKNDNKVTLYKGIFGFQIYLLKDRTYPRMTALYDSCGVKRSEDDYDSWIKALKDKVGFTRPEPKIDQDGYSYIESTTLNIDASELFERLTYRQFKTKKDNATEERFFVMLCYIAMYEYQCDRGNYHDALTCISYANCAYGTFGNLDFAKNIILSDSARNNGSKKGVKQKESVIAYMRKILASRRWKTQDDFFNRIEEDMDDGLCCKKSRGSIKTYFYKSIPDSEKSTIDRQPKRLKNFVG